MIKKLMLAALTLCMAASFASAGFGIGVKAGAGENDPKWMKDWEAQSSSYEFTEAPVFVGAELFLETGGTNKLGLRAGVDVYGQNKFEDNDFGYYNTYKENTFAVPLTLYYKYAPEESVLHMWLGGGASYIYTKFEDDTTDVNNSKIFPHVGGGIEFRFTRIFGLGFDVNYNFDAKLEKNGAVISDRSGFGGAVTARFYF